MGAESGCVDSRDSCQRALCRQHIEEPIRKEEMSTLIQFVISHGDDLINLLVCIVLGARIIVKLTPTPADDSLLEKFVGFLKHLGLHIDKK